MLGIEFLKRRVEIVVVMAGVWSLVIYVASGREKTASCGEECRDVVNVFEHVTEHDAIEFWHVRRSRADCSNVGLEAAITARGRAARRRIESGDCRESLIAEGGEQAARGAASVEDAGRSRRESEGDVGGGGGESSGVIGGNTATGRSRRVVVLGPLAIEAIVISLRGGGIGVDETAAAAHGDI